MTTWVCEDPAVIELVNAARGALKYLLLTTGGTQAYERLTDAIAAIPLPEDDR